METPKEGDEATLRLIREAGGDAGFAPCDVSRCDDLDRVITDRTARRGWLDVMVNNAAAGYVTCENLLVG